MTYRKIHRHVVMFSGGLGSWMTARRVVDKHGTEETTLVFADVGGNHSNPHEGEDEDTYRFILDAAADIEAELVVLNEGRTIWEVFRDNRFLGNSRLANCSKFLKQRPAREWLEANCDPEQTTVYVGIDWTETHRLPAIRNAYLPYRAEAPLTDPPYVDRDDMIKACKDAGIAVPRLYKAGFPHNNCGGFCVRAGQAQMEKLYREHPQRYLHHERKEEELRVFLGKDVAVLRSRKGGKSKPITLREFRDQLDARLPFDQDDFGGCGCFVDVEETNPAEETP